jgi:hypothetical protein
MKRSLRPPAQGAGGLIATALLASCELIAGYSGKEPRTSEAGATDASSTADVASTMDVVEEHARDATGSFDAAADREAGACPILTGVDLCSGIPKFTASSEIVDGVGDEFCDIPAMVFDFNHCATEYFTGSEPPKSEQQVVLRAAWSTDAFHVDVRVTDSRIVVNADPSMLWNGDAIEIYLAASSTLNGPFDGHKDGGAVQIVLTPPTETLAAVGAAFYSPGGGAAPFDALLKATDYAGRLVDGGYEIEMRLPWSADAEAILSGVKIGFDVDIDAEDEVDAGGRQLQCLLHETAVDGSAFCGYAKGVPAQPFCDDRTWCQPTLLP